MAAEYKKSIINTLKTHHSKRQPLQTQGLPQLADVMELADMQDLGSCAERRMGSTPFIRTKSEKLCIRMGTELFTLGEA